MKQEKLLWPPGPPQASIERGAASCLAGHGLTLPPATPLQIYADPSKRLELYFRPKDPYCHPVCANRFSTSSLLLRIKRRRQRGAPGSEARLDLQVLGIVATVYKFQGSCKRVLPAPGCFGPVSLMPAGAGWVIRAVKGPGSARGEGQG